MDDEFKISEKAPHGLWLRSAPIVKESTKVTVLPMGQLVTKVAESSILGWWKISTTQNGTLLAGFVNSIYLTPADTFVPPVAVTNISAVHLSANGPVVRSSAGQRAFPLNEVGRRTRDGSATAQVRASELTAIVDWLDVENQARYEPTSSNTFCNIYAYDYCYLSGVYLPRVWWTQSALDKLSKGTLVSPIYGQTVNELNANSLFDWLKEFGAMFGWRRTFDLTEMQKAANDGMVVVICAQNKLLNRSGHICLVVPETQLNVANHNGVSVMIPLQSQSGRINKKYFSRNWWTSITFREFGFWINEI